MKLGRDRYKFRITGAPDLTPVLRTACLHLKLANWMALETVGPLVIYERGISVTHTDPGYSKCLFGEVLARKLRYCALVWHSQIFS